MMASDEEEDFVFYGTPIEREEEMTKIEREEEMTSRKKKSVAEASGQLRALPPWKQEVRDEEGRRRLHGAFTGGFSAGYFSTVGSKEGWAPQTFTSSRKSRVEFKQQDILNFLDEDERADMENRSIGTSSQFDTFGFTAAETARKQADNEQKKRPSAIPGPIHDELVVPATESVGVRLLLKMGWNPSFQNSPAPLSSSVTRLWRPAAQRNLRNQWSNLFASRQKWDSVSSSGRSHATSLVNSYLSQNPKRQDATQSYGDFGPEDFLFLNEGMPEDRPSLLCSKKAPMIDKPQTMQFQISRVLRASLNLIQLWRADTKYMHAMDLGVLKDMPDIKERASWKLFKQQELHRSKLLSSYKDLVSVVNNMVNTSRSMRCYQKGPNSSPLIQFGASSENKNDLGDGGGIPVFGFWSVSYIETVAQELVQIFTLELCLKRLLVMELLTISCEVSPSIDKLCWSNELYPGEFDDLSICNLYCVQNSEPLVPTINGRKAENIVLQTNNQPDQEILQFYLTTWFTEVNIDTRRVDEIFSTIREEMHVTIS